MSEKIVSVDRALDVLITLANNENEMGVSEIARKLDLHKSTVHRILATLENKGFVYRNEKEGKYWLGIKIYSLGAIVKEKSVLVDLFKPYTKKLFDEFHEVVNVSILDRDSSSGYKSILVLKEADTRKTLVVNPRLGASSDIHISSAGKCLAAFSNDLDLNKFKTLKKYTENTIINLDDFLEELDQVRKNGFAVDNEEKEIGLTCIGAPILDKNKNVVASISISGPTTRIKQNNFQYKIKRVKEIAAEISEVMEQLG